MPSILSLLSVATAALSPLLNLANAQATSGSFTFVTYNIAGLPEILSSGDPEANTGEIGRRLPPYPIVHVQEDFNYHAYLYATDTHPSRTATSGGVPFGDGLNTLSNWGWLDFERTKWNDCSIGSGDCLTPKGYTFMRIRLDQGVYLDVYNLHTDAGTDSGDISARASNIRQVISRINEWSIGNAVIVAGDTNTRYTRTGDIPRAFLDAGFTDPWVSLIRGGNPPALGSSALVCAFPPTNDCEVVDKFFYRSSRSINLAATAYNNLHTSFTNSTGGPLSDHYPIGVQFSWSLASNIRRSDLFGGPHGDWFNDEPYLPSNPSAAISSVTLRGGSRLDAVSMTRADGYVYSHGGTGGSASTLTLNSGEYFVSATLTQGQKSGNTRIFSAVLRTSSGRTLSAGSATSDTVTYTAPSGFKIVGFYGRDGDEIDRLGFLYAPV